MAISLQAAPRLKHHKTGYKYIKLDILVIVSFTSPSISYRFWYNQFPCTFIRSAGTYAPNIIYQSGGDIENRGCMLLAYQQQGRKGYWLCWPIFPALSFCKCTFSPSNWSLYLFLKFLITIMLFNDILPLKHVFQIHLHMFLLHFTLFVLCETSCSVSIYACELKTSVHTDWLFSVLVNINETQFLQFEIAIQTCEG